MRVSLAHNDARGLFYVYTYIGAGGRPVHVYARKCRPAIKKSYVRVTCQVGSSASRHAPATLLIVYSGACAADARRRRPNISIAPALLHLQTRPAQFWLFPSCAAVFHSTENNQFQNAVCDCQRKCITELNVNLKSVYMLVMSCRSWEKDQTLTLL